MINSKLGEKNNQLFNGVYIFFFFGHKIFVNLIQNNE